MACVAARQSLDAVTVSLERVDRDAQATRRAALKVAYGTNDSAALVDEAKAAEARSTRCRKEAAAAWTGPAERFASEVVADLEKVAAGTLRELAKLMDERAQRAKETAA